jgi:hypothetical protein
MSVFRLLRTFRGGCPVDYRVHTTVLEGRPAQAAYMPNHLVAKQLSRALTAERHPIGADELLRHARSWFPVVSAKAANT